MALKETLTQRREKLTEKVRQARQEFHNTEIKVKYEVRKANPGLKERDWVKFYELVEADVRYKIAAAVLEAYCEAARIMGADLG